MRPDDDVPWWRVGWSRSVIYTATTQLGTRTIPCDCCGADELGGMTVLVAGRRFCSSECEEAWFVNRALLRSEDPA